MTLAGVSRAALVAILKTILSLYPQRQAVSAIADRLVVVVFPCIFHGYLKYMRTTLPSETIRST